MNYRNYLPDGTQVSEIGFGAWQLGIDSGWKNVSEKEALYLVHNALDRGVNFFDTAPVYGNGTSELRLGKAFKGIDRDRIVVNSKFGRLDDGTVDFSAKHLKSTVEGSLKRLGIDYLDSVIIHSPPLEYLDGNNNDHYAILEVLQQEGKIKAYGASIDSYEEISLLLRTTSATIIHAFFNILHQDMLRAADIIRETGARVVAKIPLDSGWLSGKYHKDSVFTGVRNRWSKEDIRVRALLVEELKQIVGSERTLAQVALAFCLANDLVCAVIPGIRNEEQLITNIKSSDIPIPDDLTQQLHAFYQNKVRPLRLPW